MDGLLDEFGSGDAQARAESWRYSRQALRALEQQPFQNAEGNVAVPPALIERFDWPQTRGHRLVFVNGHFAPQLSRAARGPDGVCATNLHRPPGGGADILAAHLTRYADYRRHPFTALNTAFFEDGAFVRVPEGTYVEEPIHLLFLSVPGAEPTVSHPRVLILAEPGSRATFVETYAGIGDGVYFTNAVTELVAGEGSGKSSLEAARSSTPPAQTLVQGGMRLSIRTVERPAWAQR